MARNDETAVKTGKIKLTRTHTDHGVEYQPGDVLELREDQIDWLVREGRGERVAKREEAANTPRADPSAGSEQADPSAGSGPTANAGE